jgi:predicted enzyme related to lactoylglutathione lyase
MMHQVNEIPFVCYPVTDKKRACDFYEGLFDLKIDQGYVAPDGFWSEADIGAGTLAICSFWKASAEPSMGPAIAFEVENLETAVAELKAAGVPFAMEPLETPVCYMAVVTYPDGNSLFIHKRKPGHC